jgi:hypothetical protein
MVAIPLTVYTLAATVIPESGTNIFVYLAILFCISSIVAVILLYGSNAVKKVLRKYVFKNAWRSDRYFHPELLYSFIGVIVVSALLIHCSGASVFTENAGTIFQSFQNTSDDLLPGSGAGISATTSQIMPTSTPRPKLITLQNSVSVSQTQRPTTIPPTTERSDFKKSPKTISYSYVVSGDRDSIRFTTYGGLSDYFSKESHSYYSNADKEVIFELLENDYQDEYLQSLLDTIRKKSSDTNEQAKITISLVQHIPYNWNKYYGTSSDWYYPYETLYNNKGVCADKSLLLAYLLNELGYDTVLFEFSNHMAVGVKCSSTYDFYDTGYAFVETTRPIIVTYIPDTYYGGFTITSDPHIIHLNGGKKSLDVSSEYNDAIKMKQLESMGTVLDQYHYAEWLQITNKYDLRYET